MGAKGITITTSRIKTCPQCGIEFSCPFGTGIGVWSRRTYCGSKCFGLSHRKREKKNCILCGKEFETTYKRIKYCSKRCVDADPNAVKRRKGKESPNYNRVTKNCEVCGKSFLIIPARVKSAKCSRKCASEWISITRSGENCPTWNGGSSFEEYDVSFNRRLKTLIRERDGGKCFVCDKPQLNFSYKLPVHHIDYDKKNSSVDNLVSLCRHCHTSTNHNRDQWLNYFQARKESYGTPRV